jgi:hypothetical protein
VNEGTDRLLVLMGVRRSGTCLLDILGFLGIHILARESAQPKAAP